MAKEGHEYSGTFISPRFSCPGDSVCASLAKQMI